MQAKNKIYEKNQFLTDSRNEKCAWAYTLYFTVFRRRPATAVSPLNRFHPVLIFLNVSMGPEKA